MSDLALLLHAKNAATDQPTELFCNLNAANVEAFSNRKDRLILAHSSVQKVLRLRRSRVKRNRSAIKQCSSIAFSSKRFASVQSYAVIVRETTEASQSELHFTRAELGIL